MSLADSAASCLHGVERLSCGTVAHNMQCNETYRNVQGLAEDYFQMGSDFEVEAHVQRPALKAALEVGER